METVGLYIDSSEHSLSKIHILRGLVTEKMTTAVREILAVVETTVAGYETEVSLLKQEVDHHQKQLNALLKPKVNLFRIGLEDDTLCHVSLREHNDQSLESKTLEHKDTETIDHPTSEISTQKNEVDSVPTNVQVSQQEMESSEHEDGDCTLEDLPSDSSESCPSNREGSHSHNKINDVQNKDRKSKRRKRLPRRYRSKHTDSDSDNNVIEDNSDNDWEPDQNEKLQVSKVKKRRVIKLQIGVLKCSDTELSDNAFRSAPFHTIMCKQNLSESDFLKELRSTFPDLRENKPFEAFLSESSKSPLLVNKMTPADLYRAFRSTRKRQFTFYIQLKDNKDVCDTLTNTPTSHDDNKLSTSPCGSLIEQPLETGEQCKSTDEADMSSADSATQSEEDEGQDHDRSNDWKPDQNQSSTDKSQECQVCGTSFKSRAVLTKHALSHVDDPEGLCGVCGQHFQSSEELRCHLDTHQKLYQCDTCGRFFISKFSFQKHFDSHGTEKPFKCQICPKAFVCEDDLNRHELDHKDKPYKCDTCLKSFLYKLQLDFHNQEHTVGKPFCCDVCGKLLSNFRSLCRHKQIHTGQKNYSCKYCGKLFFNPSNVKKHEITHTTREKTFLCDICSKSFHTEGLLKGHQEKHEGKHIQNCPVCNKPIKGGLRRHLMIHTGERPLSCTECDMKFISSSHLKNHLVTHTGIKEFTCKVCRKSYGRKEHLNVHMRTHTGERPYKCTLCDKDFTQLHCLKTHKKIHHAEQQSTVLNENKEQ